VEITALILLSVAQVGVLLVLYKLYNKVATVSTVTPIHYQYPCPICLGNKKVQGDVHEYDPKTGQPISYEQNKTCYFCLGMGYLEKEAKPIYEQKLVRWEK